MNHAKMKRTLFSALKSAGKVLKTAISKRKVIEKKSELSLVTHIDKRAEKIVIQTIRKSFPDHAILTEESPPMGSSQSRWIIDPLDGTTNFAHSYPIACVSIAYEEKGRVVLGGVLDPFRDELFFATRGKGAFLNGKKIKVSKAKTLGESLLCTGFPYDRRKNPNQYLDVVKAFMMKCQGIRRTGSAALDLCYVAAGRLDGFWETKLEAWDKAAGMLIVKEAGGSLSNFHGKPLTLDDVQNAVSNKNIHKEMLQVLKRFRHVGLR